MRLWSVHPRYLDRQALVACWREALLAQAVISRSDGGYSRHPQLERFRAQPTPSDAISAFLTGIADEADARGYSFTRAKINPLSSAVEPFAVTTGQLDYEWEHLRQKFRARSPELLERWATTEGPEPHPLFFSADGGIEPWERIKA